MISALNCPAGSEGSKLCKLLFVPDTPYLAGYTQGSNASLVVWNLLTESVWWSYALTVSAMAVDPESSYIVVAVPAQHAEQAQHAQTAADPISNAAQPGPAAQNGADTASKAGQLLSQGPLTVTSGSEDQAIVGGSAVFLFDPATAQPRLSWNLGQRTAAALMFALPNTQLHAASVALSEDGVSPLLVLTDDRQYAIAPSLSSLQNIAQGQAAQPRMQGHPEEAGMFEATFGKLGKQRPAQPAHLQARKQQAVQSQLQLLFDAPSHVLPPLNVLAPAFFDALVTQGGQPL